MMVLVWAGQGRAEQEGEVQAGLGSGSSGQVGRNLR